MGEKRYFISEASKLVGVESHVLRYWEEQLMLQIKRNEMGHRYYIEEDITLLQNIKKLMEKGIQLRGVKLVIPELKGKTEGDILDLLEKESERKLFEEEEEEEMRTEKKAVEKNDGESTLDMLLAGEDAGSQDSESSAVSVSKPEEMRTSREGRMAQFQEIMSDLIVQALRQNNAELACTVGENVSERVIKEMDYLMRIKEEQEEDRYKKLDETIRSLQKSKSESLFGHSFKEKKKSKFRKTT